MPSDWIVVPTQKLQKHQMEAGSFLPTMRQFVSFIILQIENYNSFFYQEPLLDAFPFVKFQSTDDMNDATVQVKKKYAVFDMNKKRLEKKERIKYLTDFQVTSPPEKISLKDFWTRKKGDVGSVEGFWEEHKSQHVNFEYIENQKIPMGLLNMKKYPIKWNLNAENFLQGKTEGDLEGVTEQTFYVGSKYAAFPFHREDSDLRSVNLHLGGKEKVKKVKNIIHIEIFNFRFGWEQIIGTRLKLTKF